MPPQSSRPLCCVHDGVSVLVVPRTDAATASIAALKVQVEGQADDKAIEAPTALPAGSVRGVALHGGAVVIWSATRLEAYALRRSNASLVTGLTPLGALPFPAPPAAVAVVGSGDGGLGEGSVVIGAGVSAAVFVAVDTRVEIYRLPSPPTPHNDDRTAPRPPSACLAFTEREGRPARLNAHGSLLAAATEKGCFKLFDAARHLPRQLGSSGSLALSNNINILQPLYIKSLRINADGSWASILAPIPRPYKDEEEGKEEGEEGPTMGLFLYDVDRDAVLPLPPDFFGDAAAAMSVTAHAWDARDPRLLACELLLPGGGGEREVATLFVAASSTPAEGMDAKSSPCLLLDRFPLPSPPLHALVALSVPRLYLIEEEEGPGQRLLRRTMRAFVGLDYEGMNDAAQAALRAFHSHLLRGDLSAAYRAGAGLRNPVVWENMARLCVRARRLDAATLCLGQMGHARGMRALREAKLDAAASGSVQDASSHPNPSPAAMLVPLAAAATQLGMLDEAARLYREARRPDLLLRLLKARGQWAEALAMVDGGECALWRRRVHYEYAGWLEAMGRVGEAAGHYAAAGAQHRETPRMLLLHHHAPDDDDDDNALARYITTESSTSTSSPALLRWWAAHCEARGRFLEAKAAYGRAGAWAELVRLACYEGDVAGAEAIIAEHAQQRGGGSNKKAMAAACFRLAQHLEGQEERDVLRAMEYYAKAGCYNHCVRLARAHGLDGEAAAYALKGPPSLMRDAARHFASPRTNQNNRNLPLALQLYTKAKDWESALALCLRAAKNDSNSNKAASWLVDAGREIAQGLLRLLLSDADPPTPAMAPGVSRLAALLEGWGHPAEAVQLHLLHLTCSPSLDAAHRVLRRCRRHAVPLTEEMLDRLLLVVVGGEGAADNESKGGGDSAGLLLEAARVCEAQGAHASASRLYTQAGDRGKALKCLFALGDADGVIRYASAARRPELFLLAAEHLWRAGLWRRDERVRAAVGEFLVRGKAEGAVVRAWEEESGRCRMLMKGV